MVLAGGTDLLPNMKRRQQTPQTLIGLRGIAGFADIHNGRGLTVGAGVTLDLTADPRIRREYPGLWQAAAQVATPHLRNMGTIGGNLCLDTRCTYLQSELRVAQGDRLLFEERRRNVLGSDVQPEVPRGVVDGHRPNAAGAGRVRHAGLDARTAGIAGRRSICERRHALPDEASRMKS